MYFQIARIAMLSALVQFGLSGTSLAQTSRRAFDAMTQPIRGATLGPIECLSKPCGYGTQQSAAVLQELKGIGVNWVALTPFGRLWDLKSTRIRLDFEIPFVRSRQEVIAMARQAHALGMRVMIIPHIFVESSGLKGDQAGHWRGETGAASKTYWMKYQRSYEDFVMAWAKVAEQAQAEAFSIGAECTSWSGRFGDTWLHLIKRVRSQFSGALTYSANWYEEAHHVIFWDALEFIGINAFYDLADHENASTDTYRKAAQKHADDLEELAKVHGKPIVFMELGFTSRPNAGMHPWRWPENPQGPAQIDLEEQRRGFEVMTDAFLPRPWFHGFFVWRYAASLTDLQEPAWGYSPLDKPAHALLKKVFNRVWAADKPP